MQLTDEQIKKIDDPLREVLLEAREGDIIYVLMILRQIADDHQVDDGDEPVPTDMKSRSKWREKLIQKQLEQTRRNNSQGIKLLKGLQLEVRGGNTSRTIVVFGTAENLLKALDLPEVEHASLNKPMTI